MGRHTFPYYYFLPWGVLRQLLLSSYRPMIGLILHRGSSSTRNAVVEWTLSCLFGCVGEVRPSSADKSSLPLRIINTGISSFRLRPWLIVAFPSFTHRVSREYLIPALSNANPAPIVMTCCTAKYSYVDNSYHAIQHIHRPFKLTRMLLSN